MQICGHLYKQVENAHEYVRTSIIDGKPYSFATGFGKLIHKMLPSFEYRKLGDFTYHILTDPLTIKTYLMKGNSQDNKPKGSKIGE